MNEMTTPSAGLPAAASDLPFDSLPLAPAMLDTLRQLDYRTMTPIQAASQIGKASCRERV